MCKKNKDEYLDYLKMRSAENGGGFFQQAPEEFLVMVTDGRIDLNKWAEFELKNRGLSKKGIWVGFNSYT